MVLISDAQVLHSSSCTEEKLASDSVSVGVCSVTEREWAKWAERTEWSQRFQFI